MSLLFFGQGDLSWVQERGGVKFSKILRAFPDKGRGLTDLEFFFWGGGGGRGQAKTR